MSWDYNLINLIVDRKNAKSFGTFQLPHNNPFICDRYLQYFQRLLSSRFLTTVLVHYAAMFFAVETFFFLMLSPLADYHFTNNVMFQTLTGKEIEIDIEPTDKVMYEIKCPYTIG